MGDIRGFLKHTRELPQRRPVDERLGDWREVYKPFATHRLRDQASRCMDCGVPFCTVGCPVGNIIPDWNDLVYRDRWREAMDRLHATNNFPEFTGRLCPAPCEASCVLGINQPPVTIKQVELAIAERSWDEGWLTPVVPEKRTGKRIAVVGSGPAGLAAAQQLTRAGHGVVVFERNEKIGGLLRFGIPDFKMEKWVIDRRLEQMAGEGTEFRTGVNVGVDVAVDDLRREFDALVLAGGATAWRDLPMPGRELQGIHQAMEYLPDSNRVGSGDLAEHPINAAGKHVVIIGGGDTGADCLGTANRQGAASVTQLEIMPRPPEERSPNTPWPMWPLMYMSSSAHEEGVEQVYAISTTEFVGDGDGNLKGIATVGVDVSSEGGRPTFTPVEGSEREIPCELVFLAMGFVGPQREGMIEQLGVELDERGNVKRDDEWRTSEDGVYVCGDMGRGQSLIVWAISEGRACAASVDRALMGSTDLQTVITPATGPIR